VVHLLPLIVPPIYEKAARYQNVVQPLWGAAAEEIRKAEKLIIFGYSFPDTDFAARSMLKRSFHQNDILEEISVIDIDATVASKISALLGVASTHHYISVPAMKTAEGLDLR